MNSRLKSVPGKSKQMRALSFAVAQVFGASLAVGMVATGAHAQSQAGAQQVEKLEITGSRVKRAEVEGALPVTVITREDLEASGQETVAEFIRSVTFNTAGNFRPQSGSSAQGFSEVNLRGLGGFRTLVLVDGRRIAKSPIVGDSVDMNSIPLAAVERIEILTDGASAIYGSEAIGGVVNIILRKNFDGVALTYTPTRVSLPLEGGDRQGGSAILGVSGNKGRVIMGASYSDREIIFTRNAFGTAGSRGASSFSNNYFRLSGSFLAPVPNGCNDPGFYFAASRCRYDFASVAADEAALSTKSFFSRGEYNINADWTAFMTSSVNRVESFGRYAPVPGYVLIEPGTIAHPWHPNYPDPSLRTQVGQNESILLGHRFAAGGPRDTNTETNLYDTLLGVKGRFMGADVEAGVRKSTSKYVEVGRGYVIETLARAEIASGAYNVFRPASTPVDVLNRFTTNIGRDGKFDQTEQYVNGTVDVFKLAGGMARLYAGYEQRKEVYADLYDPLSEGGVILGSAGNSAAGSRKVRAFGGELVMPFTKQLEGTVAGRAERYSDYGNDFSPKFSLRWAPNKDVTLRGSVGEGFGAPSLPQLTSKPAFSADSIIDRRHCLAETGGDVAFCNTNPSFQINGLVISNPELGSEKSKQWSFGGTWDVAKNASLRADMWNTKIDDVIRSIGAQTLVNRDNGTSSLPVPAGLGVVRDSTGLITQVVRGSTNEGTIELRGIDLNAVMSNTLGKFGRLRNELTVSRVLRANSNGVDFKDSFEYPTNRATLANRWNMGNFDAAWNINYIGEHGDKAGLYAGGVTTHDLQFGWATPLKGTKIVVGAVNAFEKRPPLVTSDTRPFSYVLYDGYGRQAYLRVEVKM